MIEIDSEFLRFQRIVRGFTSAADIAEVAGIGESTMYGCEKENKSSNQTLPKIVDALNTREPKDTLTKAHFETVSFLGREAVTGNSKATYDGIAKKINQVVAEELKLGINSLHDAIRVNGERIERAITEGRTTKWLKGQIDDAIRWKYSQKEKTLKPHSIKTNAASGGNDDITIDIELGSKSGTSQFFKINEDFQRQYAVYTVKLRDSYRKTINSKEELPHSPAWWKDFTTPQGNGVSIENLGKVAEIISRYLADEHDVAVTYRKLVANPHGLSRNVGASIVGEEAIKDRLEEESFEVLDLTEAEIEAANVGNAAIELAGDGSNEKKALAKAGVQKIDFGSTQTEQPQVVTQHSNEPIYWDIPPKANRFTGRRPYIQWIHKRLKKSKAVAIYGLGGMGKTETALAYANKYKQKYAAGFSVLAVDTTTADNSFLRIYGLLELKPEEPTIVQAKRAVLRWFNQHHDWLVIFDNADDPTMELASYIPKGRGDVVITSRAGDLRCLGIFDNNRIELEKLVGDESVKLLKRLIGKVRLAESEQVAAEEIAKEVDGLPLALELVASYVCAGALFTDYLESFRKHPIEWLSEKTGTSRGYQQSVATAWSMNFRTVEAEAPASAELLRFSAFLAPDLIPYELLVAGSSEMGPVLSKALEGANEEPLRVTALLKPLYRYSLVKVGQQKSYVIHRLVQEVMKEEVGRENWKGWTKREALAVLATAKHHTVSNLIEFGRLAPHVQLAVQNYQQLSFDEIVGSRLVDYLARLYLSFGRYEEAVPLCQQGLEIRRKILGEDHLDYASSLNNLAVLYRSMGRYEEAERLYQSSIEISRKALGEENIGFAKSLNNLASLYDSMGRYEEAVPLCQRGLEIRRKILGEEHPSFGSSLNNLAKLYTSIGKYEEAVPLYKHALEIRRKILGVDHPDFALSLNNLGNLYDSMGRYKEAERLLQQATASFRNALGEDHPGFATCLNNLGNLYVSMGRYEEAERLLRQATASFRNALGEDHPNSAKSLNNLAKLYHSMARFEEAEPLYKRSMEITGKALGEDHPDFATCLHNLAVLYRSMGNYEKVESLNIRSMEIRRKILGEDHLEFALSLNNLASLYDAMGRYEEAEPLYERSMEITANALGEDHPDFATCLHNLGNLHVAMRQYEEAERLLQQGMEITGKALGERHPKFVTTVMALASLYIEINDFTTARSLLLKTIRICTSLYGKKHAKTVYARQVYDRLLGDMSGDEESNC